MATSNTQPATPVLGLHQTNWGETVAIRWTALRRRWARHRQRSALRELADDPHLLKDIGLARQQALDEAAKPFWP
jgi:uncharacterized protein YjiS (DUF1127 family)